MPRLASNERYLLDFANIYPNSSTQDSLSGFQAAVNYCRDNQLTLILPDNDTIYIGSTLHLQENTPDGQGNQIGYYAYRVMARRHTAKCVIRALPSSTYWNQTDPLTGQRRPIVRAFKGETLDVDFNLESYNNILANVHIHTGGKSEAIGLQVTGHQGNVLMGIEITATGSHTGMQGGYGVAALNHDILIRGGRVYQLNTSAGYPTDAGVMTPLYSCVTLIDAESGCVPVYNQSLRGGSSMLGCKIIANAGPLIQNPSASSTSQGNHIGLYDCWLEITGAAGEAIRNTGNRSVSITTSTFVNCSQVVNNGSVADYSGSAGNKFWVKRYSASPTSFGDGMTAIDLIDGVESVTSPYAHASNGIDNTKTEFRSDRWKINLPDVETDFVWATADFGIPAEAMPAGTDAVPTATVDRSAEINDFLQYCADIGKGAFFEGGTYGTASTVTVPANCKAVMFSPGVQSRLYPLDSWNPPVPNTPMLELEDDPSAIYKIWFPTVLPHNRIRVGGQSSYDRNLTAIRWRGGRTGNAIMVAPWMSATSTPYLYNPDLKTYLIDGPNAGGRAYGFVAQHRHARSTNPAGTLYNNMTAGYRRIKFDNISGPFISIGFNPENPEEPAHPEKANSWVEMTNCSNIMIIGTKYELALHQKAFIDVNNCNNIHFSTTSVATGPDAPEKDSIIAFDNSTNVSHSMGTWRLDTPPSSNAIIRELNYAAPTASADRESILVRYERGEFDTSPFDALTFTDPAPVVPSDSVGAFILNENYRGRTRLHPDVTDYNKRVMKLTGKSIPLYQLEPLNEMVKRLEKSGLWRGVVAFQFWLGDSAQCVVKLGSGLSGAIAGARIPDDVAYGGLLANHDPRIGLTKTASGQYIDTGVVVPNLPTGMGVAHMGGPTFLVTDARRVFLGSDMPGEGSIVYFDPVGAARAFAGYISMVVAPGGGSTGQLKSSAQVTAGDLLPEKIFFTLRNSATSGVFVSEGGRETNVTTAITPTVGAQAYYAFGAAAGAGAVSQPAPDGTSLGGYYITNATWNTPQSIDFAQEVHRFMRKIGRTV